jgi:hypothetical protein
MTPWDMLTALADSKLQIPLTHHLVTRFKAIRDEILELGQANNVQEFVGRWLGEQIAADEPFQILLVSCLPLPRVQPHYWKH